MGKKIIVAGLGHGGIAVAGLLAEKGYDVQFGARPLKRAIQTYIEDELSELDKSYMRFGRMFEKYFVSLHSYSFGK